METARIESKNGTSVIINGSREYSLSGLLPSDYRIQATGEQIERYEEDLLVGPRVGIDYKTKTIFCLDDQKLDYSDYPWEELRRANRALILLQIARANIPPTKKVEEYLYEKKVDGRLEDTLEELYQRDKLAVERAFQIGQELAQQGFPLTETPEQLQRLLQKALVARMKRYDNTLSCYLHRPGDLNFEQADEMLKNSKLHKTFLREGGTDFVLYYW